MPLSKLEFLNKKLRYFNSLEIPTLYHVTTEKNANKIIKEGLKTEFMSQNHVDMELQPQKSLIYLSKHPNSNNLPCTLFDSEEKLVSLEIDPSFLDLNAIYPDDGMFMAIGQEHIFESVEEIQDVLDIPLDEAKEIYEETFKLTPETIDSWKIFALWYLHTEGEISTPQNIKPKYISFSHFL